MDIQAHRRHQIGEQGKEDPKGKMVHSQAPQDNFSHPKLYRVPSRVAVIHRLIMGNFPVQGALWVSLIMEAFVPETWVL